MGTVRARGPALGNWDTNVVCEESVAGYLDS
jgi:hypothetical protein